MKKTRLVALGLGALSIAGLVGAGVGLSVNNNVRADEVKAVGDHSGYNFYLVGRLGTENTDLWSSRDSSRKFTYNAINDTYTLTYQLYKDNEFKIVNNNTNTWNGYFDALYPNFNSSGLDNNIKVLNDGSYTFVINGEMVSHGENSNYFYIKRSDVASTTDTMTIWASSEDGGWTDAGATIKLGGWGPSANGHSIYSSDYSETSNGHVYYRFQIPTDTAYLQGLRFNSTGTDQWNVTNYTNNVASNSVYWCSKEGGDFSISAPRSVNDGECTATMFGAAIEYIKTCSSDSDFGYGAYSSLKSNFYDKLAGGVNLASVNVTDYSYTDYVNAGKTYSDISRNVSYTAQQKWDTITSLHNGTYFGPSLAKNSDATNNYEPMTIVAGVSVGVGTVAAGSFLFIRKRKMM